MTSNTATKMTCIKNDDFWAPFGPTRRTEVTLGGFIAND